MKQSNKKSKYQYHMLGMFHGTDDNYYEIDIPAPFLYDSEKEAMEAEKIGYRFMMFEEPYIFIYEKENWKAAVDESGEKCIKSWIEGEVLANYTFQEFKKAGGKIRMLKPDHQGTCLEEEDFIDTENNFTDCFPGMEPCKLYYIDSEAYYIKKM